MYRRYKAEHLKNNKMSRQRSGSISEDMGSHAMAAQDESKGVELIKKSIVQNMVQRIECGAQEDESDVHVFVVMGASVS